MKRSVCSTLTQAHRRHAETARSSWILNSSCEKALSGWPCDPEMEKLREIAAPRLSRRKGYRQVGIRIRLDKRRTVKAKVKRKLATRHTHEHFLGDRDRFPFHDDDLIYRHLITDTKKESASACRSVLSSVTARCLPRPPTRALWVRPSSLRRDRVIYPGPGRQV